MAQWKYNVVHEQLIQVSTIFSIMFDNKIKSKHSDSFKSQMRAKIINYYE
jgi:hypothetical protein